MFISVFISTVTTHLRTFFKPNTVLLLLLLVLTGITYREVVTHAFLVNWDDAAYVADNKSVQGFSLANIRLVFSSFYVGNYAPVQMLSYMLDYSLWGLWPGGFLLTNLIIHCCNGFLFFRILSIVNRGLSSKAQPFAQNSSGESYFAAIATSIFLLHPVQVESVVWVSQRKNLLAMLFVLLAWEAYLRFRHADTGKGAFAYLTAIAAFLLALLSKSVAIVFPAILVLYELCDNRRMFYARLRSLMPFIIFAGVVALLAMISQKPEYGGGRVTYHGGSPLATLCTMFPVVVRYFGVIVWPSGLSAEYDPPIHSGVDAVVALSMLCVAVVLAGIYLLFRRDRIAGFWAIIFFVALLPVAQIVPLATLMNDRYLYFPMLSVSAIVAAGVCRVGVWLPCRFKSIFAGIVVLVLISSSVASYCRAQAWKDGLTLWIDAAEKTPTKVSVWLNLGEVLLQSGQLDESLDAYERAYIVAPRNVLALLNLGVLHTQFGDADRGLVALTKLVEVSPGNVKGWAYLGINHQRRGDYLAAEKMFKKALALQPESTNVQMLLENLEAM